MKENKILKWSLILSAVVVANLFFNYSLSLIFNGPEYSDFCKTENFLKSVDEQELEKDRIYREECNSNYQEARKEYEKKVFVSLILIGVLVLIAGVIIKNSVITSALSLIAFLDFIIASMRYWSYSDELLKVIILFIALVIIFYLIVKKFKQ